MNRAHAKLLTQAITIGLLGLFIFFIINTTVSNLERVGITTGLGFLSEPSGFEIAFSLLDYSSRKTHLDVFWVGVVNTLLASAIAVIFCTLIGLVVGVAQLSTNRITAIIARSYVEAFRNIPLLLNIFFWYFITINIFPSVAESFNIGGYGFLNQRGLYLPAFDLQGYASLAILALLCLPFIVVYIFSKRATEEPVSKLALFAKSMGLSLLVIVSLFAFGVLTLTVEFPSATRFNIAGGTEIIPELFALIVGLSIYHGAFVAEYVRGGILAVSKGQAEAALSTGLSNWQTMRLVVIPQALRIIIPPYISNNLNVVKNSSLGAAIAFPELMNVFAGTSLNQTGNAVEIILMVMAFYFTISMIISLVLNIYNKRIQIVER